MTNANQTLFTSVWLLCHDKDFLRTNQALMPEVFPRGSIRTLVRQALRTWERSHSLLSRNLVEMMNEGEDEKLKRSGTSQKQLLQTWDDLNTDYSVDKVDMPVATAHCRAWLEKRQMVVAMEKAQAELQKGNFPDAEASLRKSRLPTFGLSPHVSLEPGKVGNVAGLNKPKKGALPTGLIDLDHAWQGGYRRGEVGIVAGSTGVGKSMLLCLLAGVALRNDASVLYYTFELTPEQIKERILLAMLQKKASQLTGDFDQEFAKVAQQEGFTLPMKWHLDIRNGSMTWPGLAADLDEYKAEHGKYPDLLLLDSADDIAPIRGRDQLHVELRDAFVYLRQEIAEARRIRVWTSAQLNRDAVEKARVSLKNIGDAYAKAQKAHYVIGFAQTDADLEDVDGPIIRIYVLKDSLHGTRGGFLLGTAEWGRGRDGFPGLTFGPNSKVQGLMP